MEASTNQNRASTAVSSQGRWRLVAGSTAVAAALSLFSFFSSFLAAAATVVEVAERQLQLLVVAGGWRWCGHGREEEGGGGMTEETGLQRLRWVAAAIRGSCCDLSLDLSISDSLLIFLFS